MSDEDEILQAALAPHRVRAQLVEAQTQLAAALKELNETRVDRNAALRQRDEARAAIHVQFCNALGLDRFNDTLGGCLDEITLLRSSAADNDRLRALLAPPTTVRHQPAECPLARHLDPLNRGAVPLCEECWGHNLDRDRVVRLRGALEEALALLSTTLEHADRCCPNAPAGYCEACAAIRAIRARAGL